MKRGMNAVIVLALVVFCSVTALAAGNDANTKLLLHFDSNSTSPWTDSSNGGASHNVTSIGSAIFNTSSRFGAGAVHFPDSDTDYININDSEDWTLGTGNFTIDFWMYPVGSNAWQSIVMVGRNDADSIAFGTAGDNTILRIDLNNEGLGTFQSSSGTLTVGAWQHIALVRNGTSFIAYVNGTQKMTLTSTSALDNPDGIEIAKVRSGFIGNFHGRIDEFRISKGVARIHDSNDPMYIGAGSGFTPPPSQYSTSYNVVNPSLPTGWNLTTGNGTNISGSTESTVLQVRKSGRALVEFNITGDVNLSNMSVAVDESQGITVVANLSGTHKLLIPKVRAAGVFICPNANVTADVTSSCSGVYTYDESVCVAGTGNCSIVTQIGSDYYNVSGVAGSGGGNGELNNNAPEFSSWLMILGTLGLVAAGLTRIRKN